MPDTIVSIRASSCSFRERDVESQYDYFGARYYDSRIGRFHSVDRFEQKYSSFSPFSYGANNPIRFIDVNGDSLWIGQNRDQSFSYLQQLHPELASRLSLSENGLVSFNTENLDLSSDAALGLMNNLVNGGADGQFSSLNFLFEVSSEADVVSPVTNLTQRKDVEATSSGVVSASSHSFTEGTRGWIHIRGLDGQVTMGEGSWTVQGVRVPLNNITFHELSEMFHRTAGSGMYYATDRVNGRHIGGAHERAIKDAKSYSAQKYDLWLPHIYIPRTR